MENKGKNQIAVELGKLRWKGRSKEEIREHMKMMGLRSGTVRGKEYKKDQELDVTLV